MPAAAGPSAARERILDTAFRLFYARGIRAVGVDRIIAESGVAKATFYKHFPAKDDLVVAYLDQVDRDLDRPAPGRGRGGRTRPGATSSSACSTPWPRACRRDGYRGCAFINAAAESQPGTGVHDRTLAHKDAVLAWVRDLAQDAGARDPEALARSLTLLLDGGLASGSLDASPDAPAVAKASAGALVAAALAT